MDSIYALNYVAIRQINKKGEKLVVLFTNLRAAFDLVDRGVLIGMMRTKGIKEGLMRRVKEVLRKTKNKLKVGGELGKSFWTAREMKQGCPLSPSAI